MMQKSFVLKQDCAYRAKQSGSMPAEQGRPASTIGELGIKTSAIVAHTGLKKT